MALVMVRYLVSFSSFHFLFLSLSVCMCCVWLPIYVQMRACVCKSATQWLNKIVTPYRTSYNTIVEYIREATTFSPPKQSHNFSRVFFLSDIMNVYMCNIQHEANLDTHTHILKYINTNSYRKELRGLPSSFLYESHTYKHHRFNIETHTVSEIFSRTHTHTHSPHIEYTSQNMYTYYRDRIC